jgi:hypothetical protein
MLTIILSIGPLARLDRRFLPLLRALLAAPLRYRYFDHTPDAEL